MDIQLTKNDLIWLKNNYSKLKYCELKNSISGELCFNRKYKRIILSDCYHLEIKLEKKEYSVLPQVWEMDGKIKKIATELLIPLIDMHVNETDNTLCVCILDEEKEYLPNGFKIDVFFEQLLVPYLYRTSFLRKYKISPWGEYAHGRLGFLELYAENKITLGRLMEIYSENELRDISKYKGHSDCLCRSGKKVRDCHKLIYMAIYKLKKIDTKYL